MTLKLASCDQKQQLKPPPLKMNHNESAMHLPAEVLLFRYNQEK